jgi:hypothetical protein
VTSITSFWIIHLLAASFRALVNFDRQSFLDARMKIGFMFWCRCHAAFVRFRTTADNGRFWPVMDCPLMTHNVTSPPSIDAVRKVHSITSSARASRCGGDVEAERLGSLEVDDKFELCWLHHRQIGRLARYAGCAGIA